MTYVRLLLLAPVLEEWILRAGLQEYLMRKGAGHMRFCQTVVILLPALVFGLLHVREGIGFAATMAVPGLFLGVMYRYTRSWIGCAVVHALFNVLALLFCKQ